MHPSWRLALNTLAGKPGRLALMIGAVALACSLVVAVSCAVGSAQASMESSINRFLGNTDARIIHTGNWRFEDTLLEKVRRWPEVRAATGRLLGSLTLIHADSRRDPETGALFRSTPMAIGVDLDLERRFRTTELEAGRLPNRPDEVLIDPLTAKELDAKPGDALVVQRFGEPIPLTVTGIYARKRLGAVQRPIIELDRSTLAEANNQQGQLISIAIILNDDQNVEEFCRRHEADVPKTLTLEPAERARAGFNRQVQASRFGFLIASVLTFMSASFIIVTALTTSVIERQREMAVTRSIGASRGQLFGSQLIVGGIVGTTGAILGIPIGIGLTAILVWYFSDLLPTGLRIEKLGLMLALAGACIAGLAGALYPAWMASRVSPLEAMSYQGRPPRRRSLVVCAILGLAMIGIQLVLFSSDDSQTRFMTYAYVGLPAVHIGYFVLAIPVLVIVTHAVSPLLARALRLPTDMLRRSVLASPLRNGFIAGSLMVGIAILVSTWSNMMSIQRDWLGKIRIADAFAFRVTGISPQTQADIAALPFVERVCPIGVIPVQIVGRQIFGVEGLSPPYITCFGFDPELFFGMNAIDWTAGDPKAAISRLKDGSGMIVADRFLTTQRVALGDRLTLGAGRAQREFEIVGAVNSAGLDIATQSFGIRNQYMELAISSVFIDSQAMKQTFDNHDAVVLQMNLKGDIDDEEAIKRVGETAPGVMFHSGRWILKTIDEVAAALLTVQSVIAFAALFLATLGVGNVILANIQARRFEYGVFRSVGAHRRTLAKLILGEAAILALAGAVTGTMLGIHLAWIGAINYRDLAGLPLHLSIPTWPAVAGWIVLLVMTLLAAVPGVLSVIRRQPSALLAGGRHG